MGVPTPGSFSKKIELAADALGCPTLSELVAKVRAMNPDSPVTLDRAYKWAQGRATPRDPGVYDDLARVLGMGEAGPFVRSSSLAAFREQLRLKHPGWTGPAGRAAEVVSGTARAAAGPLPLPPRLADGHYAAYSLAWAPGHVGQVVRGSVRVVTEVGGPRARIEYVEDDARGRVVFTGDLRASGRLLAVTFDPSSYDMLLSMVLAVSPQPSPAFGGLLIGQSLQPGSARPICGRLLMVGMRDPAAAPAAGRRYLDPDGAALADDLAAIGYGAADCAGVARKIVDYLAAPSGGQMNIAPQAIEEIVLPLALAGVRPLARVS